ncbi:MULTISPECIES: adenylate kinase [unclassified Pseudomonas]|jgi:adenylate kinase family enzyme|uniref:adenylate kinase n=1 Tax=unclassified Pseudomonas TaxID=196821 RepID=UPI000BB3CBC8|nr:MULTISPECIES: adenylate kinase [unclassified Pseudomonas]PBJ05158.1 topology modulation protein [Pseudomonas sp. ACN5]PMZ73033.1 adenylate kinase [Pseudomonas sp. FW305-70]
MDLTRTLIIGNSGSGKSWLAQQLAQQLREPWTDLDRIHWLSDEHSIPRPRAEALAMARIAADEQRWVIEGVYGWIISEILHRATALIWLSIGDEECVTNIRQRETQDDERLVALLEWAGSYRKRDDSSGFAAHQRLFEGFSGSNIQLMNRTEITAFASVMPGTG